jgi:hypothetical protein
MGIEHDMTPNRVRHGIDCPCGRCSLPIGVNPYLGEIVTKTRLEESPTGSIHCITGRKSRFINGDRHVESPAKGSLIRS